MGRENQQDCIADIDFHILGSSGKRQPTGFLPFIRQ